MELFESLGGLNQYDLEARTLIPQVGLFTTPDPQAGVYPWLNPYLYCAANPMKYTDPTGNEIKFAPNSTKEFKVSVLMAYALMKAKGIDGIMTDLINHEGVVYIAEPQVIIESKSSDSFDGNTGTIYWKPDESVYALDTNIILSPIELLSHECDHALESLNNPEEHQKRSADTDEIFTNKEEERVIKGSETENAQKLNKIKQNEFSRNGHHGQPIRGTSLNPSYEEALDAMCKNYGSEVTATIKLK